MIHLRLRMQTPALYLVFDDGIVSLSVNFNRANPARQADRLLNTAEYGRIRHRKDNSGSVAEQQINCGGHNEDCMLREYL